MKKILGAAAVTTMLFYGTFIAIAADISTANQQYPAPSPSSANQQYTPAANTPIHTQLQNPIKYDSFTSFVAGVTKAAVQILLPFVVLAFIYSGFLFVKAQGNTTELEKAKTAIIYSIIGAFILLGSWGFAQIIGQTVSTLTK